jgi:hypothetical protein
MATEPSKYAENQFDSATAGRFPLMSELLADTRPRLALAAATDPAFGMALTMLDTAINNWDGGETALANAEANVPGLTYALDDKLSSLTRKPDAETNSPLETWDNTIRAQVAYQGPTYMLLLPQGRETLTNGAIEARIDAGRDLGVRLAAQVAKPALVALGTTVTAFYAEARTLRTNQKTGMTTLAGKRTEQEVLRKACAAMLLHMVGVGLQVWRNEPARVDTLFDINLLRGGAQAVPDAPADTVWTPATRTLSTTAMPEGASRLAAWREGPGGMPEQLAVGDPGALEVMIPASVTFDAGDLYQLWLVALNSKGPSEPGPKQNWTAT